MIGNMPLIPCWLSSCPAATTFSVPDVSSSKNGRGLPHAVHENPSMLSELFPPFFSRKEGSIICIKEAVQCRQSKEHSRNFTGIPNVMLE